MYVSTGMEQCPKCASKGGLEARREYLKSELVRQYGSLDMSNWLALQAELQSLPRGSEFPVTLRVSSRYGIYKGYFSISYDSKCAACGWRFSFNKVKVDLKTETSGEGVYRYEISGG